MSLTNNIYDVITVTLNPAIDRTLTIPHFAPGAVNRVESVRSTAGGKGVNVASALADYGCSVAVTGFLGRENSISFEELFERKQIEDHFILIAGETRVGIKVVDPSRQETTDINFPGPAIEEVQIAVLRRHLHQLSEIGNSWFVLAGSVPPGVPAGIYGELCQLLKERGQKVALDTSGEALRLGLKAGPHLAKPNLQELETLTGRKLSSHAEIIDAARGLVESGVELVAVSMGADGAIFVTADEAVLARPPGIPVKSTVGAGDAMVAGIVAGRLGGLSLTECARMGTAFSLEALSRGESGVGSHATIEAFMEEVTVESEKSVVTF